MKAIVLRHILQCAAEIHKRVVVVGTTCSGKTTLSKLHESFIDMDDAVFDILSKKQQAVLDGPWTPEIGELMQKWTNWIIRDWDVVLFGTIIPEKTKLVFLLKVPDSVLKERCEKRNVSFETAKKMQEWIEKKVQEMDDVNYGLIEEDTEGNFKVSPTDLVIDLLHPIRIIQD